MRNFTWKRFPIKKFADRFLAYTHRGKYICKFESSQKDKSRWRSTDSSKAYRNTSAFKCTVP